MEVNGQQQAVDLGMQLGDLEQVMEQVNRSSQKTSGSIASVMTAMEFGINAVQRLNDVMSDLSQAYAVQIEAETKLANNMRNTMDATEEQIQAIKDLCSAQQEIGVVGDEVQLAGAQKLATYLTMTSSLKKLIPVMNDMIVQQNGLGASGESAATIATMLGKAMDGQVGALRRYGYIFDEAQEAILKTGSEMERAAVLAEVASSSIGGMNENMANSPVGKMQQTVNALDDYKEQLGKIAVKIQPVVNNIASAGIAALSMAQLTKALGLTRLASVALAAAGSKLAPILAGLNMQTKLLATGTGAASKAFRALGVAIKGLGVIGLVLGALAALYSHLKSTYEASFRAAQAAETLAEAYDTFNDVQARTRAEMDSEISNLRSLIDAKKDTKDAVAALNDKYGEELGYQKDAAKWLEILTNKSSAYARAKALEAESIALATQQYKIEQEQRDLLARKKEIEDKGETRVGVMTAPMGSSTTGAMMLSTGSVGTYEAPEYAKVKRDLETIGKDLDDIAAKRKTIEADIKSNSTDLTAGLTPGKGDRGDDKKKKDKTAQEKAPTPEGTLKWYDEAIADREAKLKLTVDQDSYNAVKAEIANLTTERFALLYKLTTPDDVETQLRDIQKDITAMAKMGLTLPVKLPKPGSDEAKYEGPEPITPETIDSYKLAAEAMGATASTMQSFSKIIGENAGAWVNWGANLLNTIAAALPALQTLFASNTANAGAEAMKQNASMGPFGWISGVAAIAGIIGAIATLPKFAEGGIAYGPTVGLFGEYPGAANNPEVVAPLSKLEHLLTPADPLGGRVRFVIEGRTLVGVIEKEQSLTRRRK